MKKLLLFSGAALGVYLLAKKLKNKVDNSFIGNDVATAGIGPGSGNFNGGNVPSYNNESGTSDEKVVLDDGGNEFGDTGGHIK